jgi:hypothetical protein
MTQGHGHDHLRHLTSDVTPAVFAARADVVFAQAARDDQLELLVARFCASLSDGLTGAGCSLVGHIKGTLAVRGHGDLAFHATALAAPPALTGGVVGAADDAVLTVNVIVFGVEEKALSAIVMSAWSQVSGAETVWRR